MPPEILIARRYLSQSGHGAWGRVIGWLATGSVALGVGSLIITLAVMTGFREDIRDRILGVQPHVIVSGALGDFDLAAGGLPAALDGEPAIRAWAPYITGQVLIGKGGQSSGSLLKGVDPAREPGVSGVEQKVLNGEWSSLRPASGTERGVVLLGQELARNIGARAGDTVWVMTPTSDALATMSFPRATLLKVGGLVQTGLYDYDSSLAYVHIKAAEGVFSTNGRVSGVGIRLKDVERADELARSWQAAWRGDIWVRSWLSLNRNLFSALQLEKKVMFLILILVTVVASVMIVSNLLLTISQKTREIGILRAMGADAGVIRRIFLIQGALMGALGTAIGLVLGVGISLVLQKTQLIRLPSDVYYIDRLPIRLVASDIALVAFSALFIVIVATVYPARRAAALDPLEAIRYG